MKDIPEAEARALFGAPLFCHDAPGWRSHGVTPGLAILESGLVTEDGIRTGLRIQLLFSRSPKTKVVTFKFTVFQLNLRALQRVYQLHVSAVARKPKNWHDLPHEHVGNLRFEGNESWLGWDFQEAMDHFCEVTKIAFIPQLTDPDNPEFFELKS
jgi:hypothetical protein